jgi:hypothetical protein
MKKKPKKRTETVSVHHPTVPGATERVERVFDSIGFMMPKRGGKQFPLEHSVAIRIRRAHDLINGQIGGAGDFDRMRGPGGPSHHPPIALLDAGRLLSELSKSGIDNLEHVLIDLIVCGGLSIADVTRMQVGPSRDRNFYGTKLREGLRKVARFWGWDEQPPEAKIRGFGSQQTTDIPDVVLPGQVMHATGRRIFALRRK